MAAVHSTALVEPGARLADDVEIGPYSIIGSAVRIGAGSRIGPHAVIVGRTTLGERNRVFQFASVGDIPQDRKYGGEPTTTTIGDDNVIREYVSIHAGTAQDRGDTTIGSGNLFLAYAHVAHGCVVGNATTFSNNAQIAGHVTIGDYAVLGAYAGVHQFCRIGAHAFVGMGCLVNGDVPPFVMIAADYGRPRGINAEGLKRRGFDADRIAAIKRAYRALYLGNRSQAEARAELAVIAADSKDVAVMLDFIEASGRPLVR